MIGRLTDDNEKLQQDIISFKKQISDLEAAKIAAINEARKEGDRKVRLFITYMSVNFPSSTLKKLCLQAFEERRKASSEGDRHQEEMDKLRDDLNGQISRLRADYDDKVEDLEKRLEVALGAKLEHMLALREEVEQEYADRMEDLRNMYREEMDAQSETYEKDREKSKQLELSMSDTLKVKRQEADEFRAK